MPFILATAGLIGSVGTAQLAVADDGTTTPSTSPTPTAPPAGQETATSELQSDPFAADDPVGSAGDGSGSNEAEVDDGSDQPADASVGVDCPPLFVVFFPLGSAIPRPPLGSEPDELAAWMADHPDATLIVDGHADASGTEQANLQLSFRRAEAVAALLTEAGADADRIQPRGFGEYQPVVGAPSDSERNRRVTMGVEGRTDCGLEDKETSE